MRSQSPRVAPPRRRGWDIFLLIAAALALIALPTLVTVVIIHLSLNDPWISRLPHNLLVALTFLSVAAITVVAIYGFFKGRRDARRPPTNP